MSDRERIQGFAASELGHAQNLIERDDPERYGDIAETLRLVARRYDALAELERENA